MGQYFYDQDIGCYVQKNTEKSEEMYVPRYLFSSPDNDWGGSDTPGDKSGWLYNPTPSKTLPLSGWWYYDGRSWSSDPSLVITPSPMTSLCDKIMLSFDEPAAQKKWPLCQGEFSRTEMWWNGRPVFRNSQGQLLHQSPEQGWSVGAKLGFACISGSMTHDCPASEKKWKFWDETQYLSAKVHFRCDVHEDELKIQPLYDMKLDTDVQDLQGESTSLTLIG